MGIFRKQTARAPLTTVLLVLLLALSIVASSIGFTAWMGAKKQLTEIDSQYTTIAILSGANYEKRLFGDRATFVGLDSLKFSDGSYYIGPQSAKVTAQQSPYFISAESNILLSAHVADSTAITSGTLDVLKYNSELDNHCYSLSVLAVKCVEIKPTLPSDYVDTITYIAVSEFLDWLETQRHCTVTTRNVRLAAIHSFFRYLQYEAPEYLDLCQKVLAIPFKKTEQRVLNYFSLDGIKLLLSMPDTSTKGGRRDLALLSLMYDTGARVQEIADLTPQCVRFEKPATIRLHGKGNKTRIVPMMDGG